ncbi:hypothetical protein HY492_02430 [Candidatus Woesearchaeota archaeon]|nr:hypothetical protein [Candidatus Woesearchaeota archaeon]
MNKYLLLALVFLVACAAAPEVMDAPEGTPVDIAPPAAPIIPTQTGPQPLPADAPPLADLGITVVADKVNFLSPEMKEGQWATYQVTTIGTGETIVAERSYSILTFFHRSDPCIGIERNSTVEGESRTQTMWCDDVKYVFVYNDKRGAFSDPQVLGRNVDWEDEAVQGFAVTTPAFGGLEQTTVPAGSFWTLHKSSWDGLTQKDIWASSEIPGFEAGLVKRTETSQGVTTTTELLAFGGLE